MSVCTHTLNKYMCVLVARYQDLPEAFRSQELTQILRDCRSSQMREISGWGVEVMKRTQSKKHMLH